MYRAVTRGIQVTVTPEYLPERSEPDEGQYFWAYRVEILNLSGERVQLRARYWRITDERGKTHEVRGPGVVGEQPVIESGAAFEYTSGSADDADRHHGGPLPDGHRAQRELPGGDPGLLARQPLCQPHGQLSARTSW
jgi:uncharacterized protein affecting Mg2+/Co2+ transport